MNTLARLCIGRPRLVIAGWLACMGTLALVGLGVEERLHRTNLAVSGTDAARAADLARERFGEASTLSVLLAGPPDEIDRRGPRVAAALEAEPHVTVLHPWVSGAPDALRPRRGRALLIARVDRPFDEASRESVPALRRILDRRSGPRLRAHMAGYADAAAGIEKASLDALARAEVIAGLPLLLILLLVFRSAVAAALPLLLGFVAIGAGRGVIAIVNGTVAPVDALALNMASMFGLALGVDYSLLMVSRFREELAAGRTVEEAILLTSARAGRTVRFAALALGAAMVAGLALAPSRIFTSAAAGSLTGLAVSVFGALTALPALLMVIGSRIDRWQLGGRQRSDGRWGELALRAARRPGFAALMLALLLLLCLPAAALRTAAPDVDALPASSRERLDSEAVRDAVGPGWGAPFEVLIAARSGAVTAPRRLKTIDSWQTELARDPEVAAVMGPAAIHRRTQALRSAPRRLARASAEIARSRRAQRRAVEGLEGAGTGVDSIRSGLAKASEGAARIARGAGGTDAGSGALSSGLDHASGGARELVAGLARARRGLVELASGTRRAREGARRTRAGVVRARDATGTGLPRLRSLLAHLDDGVRDLRRLRQPLETAETNLRDGLSALDRMLPTSKADPRFRQAYEQVATALGAISGRHPVTGAAVAQGYDGAAAAVDRASYGLGDVTASVRELLAELERTRTRFASLAAGSARLEAGLRRLSIGAHRLIAALDRLGTGSQNLAGGIGRLRAGGESLAASVSRVREGAEGLRSRLDGGHERTRELRSGLGRMSGGIAAFRSRAGRLASGLRGSRRLTPALSSGYFTLAALDGSGPARRRGSTFAVNLDHGGSAARVLVVGRAASDKPGNPLRDRLAADARRLEQETGMTVAVGGPGVTAQDFRSAASKRLPLLMIALALLTYLVLVPILRSLVLPAIAVALNLLTVGAAFGVLVLGFQGAAPLGGPGTIDAIMVMGIFTIVFGLSIDYEVFLLSRIGEGRELTGSTDGAIAYGLRTTARVVAGAAVIMAAVFVAFASADISSLRQFGVGLTVAVILDATVVRLVLLPAAIRLAGERAWWLPAWFDERLPRPDLERPAAGAGTP